MEGFLYYVVADLEFLCAQRQEVLDTLDDTTLLRCAHLYYNQEDGWYLRSLQGDRWYQSLERGMPKSPKAGIVFSPMLGYTLQERRDTERNRRYDALLSELKKRDLV